LFDDAADDALWRVVGAGQVIDIKPRAVAISEIERGRIYPSENRE
jgi:hypothetical protein